MSALYDFAFILVALLSLGFTIFVHELGHFMAARRRWFNYQTIFNRFWTQDFWMGKKWSGISNLIISILEAVSPFQLADMGRVEGGQEEEESNDRLAEWNKINDDEVEGEEDEDEKPNPKISYSIKMIVSVMGAVFNILFAFLLSCILWNFGYERSDGELTTKIGYIADTVERWNPIIEEKAKPFQVLQKKRAFSSEIKSLQLMVPRWKILWISKAGLLPAN